MGTGVGGGPHRVVIALGPHVLAGGRADVPVYLSPVGLAWHPPVGSPSPTHEASHSFIEASVFAGCLLHAINVPGPGDTG